AMSRVASLQIRSQGSSAAGWAAPHATPIQCRFASSALALKLGQEPAFGFLNGKLDRRAVKPATVRAVGGCRAFFVHGFRGYTVTVALAMFSTATEYASN